jgi:hypothetical protein
VCLACGRALGYVPARMLVCALEASDGHWVVADADDWLKYRYCENFEALVPCNWLLADDEQGTTCRSCRLTTRTAELSDDRLRLLWARAEAAKRYLLHTLNRLGLPLHSPAADGPVLAFALLASDPKEPENQIITGHANGLITIDLQEADDATRERVRVEMEERYRTLLGHFRHEVGHFYFLLFIAGTHWEEPFRALFGDERTDYSATLAAYYRDGAPADWAQRHISAYASAHPLEDFAECFAHYLHLTDALETGEAFGLLPMLPPLGARGGFEARLRAFMELSVAMNALNRGLGLNDPYPFVMPAPVRAKLRLVDEILHESVHTQIHYS